MTGRLLLASTLASQAPKHQPSMVSRAVLAAVIVIVLASCQGEGQGRREVTPPPPPAAAPLHPWCEACRDLPNLGKGPRVGRRGP